MNNRPGKPEDKNPEIASAERQVKAQGTLCLFRSATAQGTDMVERNLSTRPPISLVNSHPLRIGPERSRARSGEADP